VEDMKRMVTVEGNEKTFIIEEIGFTSLMRGHARRFSPST